MGRASGWKNTRVGNSIPVSPESVRSQGLLYSRTLGLGFAQILECISSCLPEGMEPG